MEKAGENVQIVANFMYKAENVVVTDMEIRIWKIVQTFGKILAMLLPFAWSPIQKTVNRHCLQDT